MKKVILISLLLCYSYCTAQSHGPFKGDKFPSNLISNDILDKRDLHNTVKNLVAECDWSTKIGKKVDVFWLQTESGNLFGHVYEYFFDCDNLRLIYWFDNPAGRGEVLDFMIESLEDDSKFVTSKKRYLKNTKKYKKYIDK